MISVLSLRFEAFRLSLLAFVSQVLFYIRLFPEIHRWPRIFAFDVLPGGFGTLGELLEVLTLIQTQKIRLFPLYLINADYWKGLVAWFQQTVAQQGAIENDDLFLFKDRDDHHSSPAEVTQYNSTTFDRQGFKIATMKDRKRALGDRH
jgi:hypothetical protein